jgi:hypothetical protein
MNAARIAHPLLAAFGGFIVEKVKPFFDVEG